MIFSKKNIYNFGFKKLNGNLKKAAKVGGAAGGQKYIVNNVMFKFAADSQGIFAFDDLAAAKVASHDLKGLMAFEFFSSFFLLSLSLSLLSFSLFSFSVQ